VRLSQRVRVGGLVVALSGFAITRLFVVEALQVDAAVPFLIAGVVPLVVGLALTVYGVALALGPFTSDYVNTVARWHVLGVGAMLVVFAITGLEGLLTGDGFRLGNDAPLLVANVLLGGAVGGTLTGVRSGRTVQQRREIRRSANQALLVNRLLKHEVINAATVVDGYASMLEDADGDREESVGAIRESVDRIKSTVEEVGTMAESGDRSSRVDAAEIVREQVATAGGADVALSVEATATTVAADERLAIVVRELVANALTHGGDDVAVELRGRPHALDLTVVDDGPGLPPAQRALLEAGEFPEYDDPTAGFGLQFVRLLVVEYGGEIGVDARADGGTAITVSLSRTGGRRVSAEAVGLSTPAVARGVLAGLVAGVAMGTFYQFATGLLPVIGSLYGVQSQLIGWVTHLFHSAVFGLVFAGICSVVPLDRAGRRPVRTALLGLGWGTMLWVVAAGTIMPLWLGLVGAGGGTPRLSPVGFVGHALWGLVVGGVYWAGSELDAVERRVGGSEGAEG
jgi:signal transduction histidine kinase